MVHLRLLVRYIRLRVGSRLLRVEADKMSTHRVSLTIEAAPGVSLIVDKELADFRVIVGHWEVSLRGDNLSVTEYPAEWPLNVVNPRRPLLLVPAQLEDSLPDGAK